MIACGGIGSGVSGVTIGATGFVSDTGLPLTSFAGTEGVLSGAAPGVVALPGSLLRNSPRATRRVPLDCSMFMGLVRTRLAPMRNAFATPA